MSVEIIRSLLAQISTLVFVAAGVTLMIAGSSSTGRSISARLMLMGIFLAVVAGLVTGAWLP